MFAGRVGWQLLNSIFSGIYWLERELYKVCIMVICVPYL